MQQRLKNRKRSAMDELRNIQHVPDESRESQWLKRAACKSSHEELWKHMASSSLPANAMHHHHHGNDGGDNDDIDDQQQHQQQEARIMMWKATSVVLDDLDDKGEHNDDGNDDDDDEENHPDTMVRNWANEWLNQVHQAENVENDDNEDGPLSKDAIRDIRVRMQNILIHKSAEQRDLDARVSTLDAVQKRAYTHMVSGVPTTNVFVTGEAGSGKSFLLTCAVRALKLEGYNVALLAPTGLAAVNCGGLVIHALLGLGPAAYTWTPHKLKLILQRRIKERGHQAFVHLSLFDVFVIDECSMVSEALLETLSTVLQVVHGSTLPFGGRRVILCGDFFQLPPIAKPPPTTEEDKKTNDADHDDEREQARIALADAQGRPRYARRKKQDELPPPYCFHSEVWRSLFPTNASYIQLQGSHRHADPTFLDLLNHIRVGHVRPEDLFALQSRMHVLDRNESTTTRLCARRETMHEWNTRQYNALSTLQVAYSPLWSIREYTERQLFFIERARQRMRNAKLYPLSPGERMVIQTRLDALLTTAAQARVILASQCPVPVDLPVNLRVGQRVVLLKNIDTSKGLVRGRTGTIMATGDDGPIVEFVSAACTGSGAAQNVLVPFASWTCPSRDGTVIVKQIPLASAWAITIHASQGLTLRGPVDIGLSDLFAAGQAYVALSRLQSFDQLRVLSLEKRCLMHVDRDVMAFYNASFNLILSSFSSSSSSLSSSSTTTSIHQLVRRTTIRGSSSSSAEAAASGRPTDADMQALRDGRLSLAALIAKYGVDAINT